MNNKHSKSSEILWFLIVGNKQASARRRRPRRPGFSIPCFRLESLSETLGFYPRCFLTKYEGYRRKYRTGTRDSMIQDDEDIDVLRSPGKKFIQKYLGLKYDNKPTVMIRTLIIGRVCMYRKSKCSS